VPPGVRVDRSRRLGRADGGAGAAPVEQLPDRALQARADVVHPPSLTVPPGRRQPGEYRRSGGRSPRKLRPRTWPAKNWISDLVPHLVYGVVPKNTIDAFDR
jgi:hypothetical protein